MHSLPSLPVVSSTYTPPAPHSPFSIRVIKDHEGTEFIEASPLRGIGSAKIRVVKVDSTTVVPQSWALVGCLGKNYMSAPEWYASWGISREDIQQASHVNASSTISSKALGQVLIQKVKLVSDKYLALIPAATVIFKGSMGWEEPLFNMTRYLQTYLPCISLIHRSPLPLFAPKMAPKTATLDNSAAISEQPFDWSTYDFTRVYIHTKRSLRIFENPLIRHNTGIEFTSHLPVVSLKPIKKANPQDQCAIAYQNMIALFKTIKTTSASKLELTGLCVPLDVLEGSGSKKKNQIIVPYPHQNLYERFATQQHIHPQERWKMAYQVTKGLQTLHAEFKYALMALRLETVVIGTDGNAYLSDYTRIQPLESKLDASLLKTFAMLPPEIFHNLERASHSNGEMFKRWDAWLLGVNLWTIATSHSLYDSAQNYEIFLNYIDQFVTYTQTCPQTLEAVSIALMETNPEKRMTVSEALSVIQSFYVNK